MYSMFHPYSRVLLYHSHCLPKLRWTFLQEVSFWHFQKGWYCQVFLLWSLTTISSLLLFIFQSVWIAKLRGAYNKFPDFFRMGHLKLLSTLQNSLCYCYILWDDWSFYDFRFKSTATAAMEYTLLKPDCHSWWISKIWHFRRMICNKIVF